MHDDIWEEDLFEEEQVNSTADESVDEDTQYVMDLMNEALKLCENANYHLQKVLEINNILDENITGIPNKTLEILNITFTDMLPNLILGENLDALINNAQKVLGTSRDFAENYVNEKRTAILENIDNNKNK